MSPMRGKVDRANERGTLFQNVLVCIRIDVRDDSAEVDHINMTEVIDSEVFRLDVSVNVVDTVQSFNAFKHP